MYVDRHQAIGRRLAALLGRVVYLAVLPRTHFRGAVRLSALPVLRSLRVWAKEGDARFQLPPFDFYWARYLYSGRPYEPEVEAALRLAAESGPALFIDAGANYGYWSVRAATGEFGPHEVVTVEASASTLELLERNVEGTICQVVRAAVSDAPGHVTFDDAALHVARGVTSTGPGTRVRAVTLDQLAGDSKKVIVKLDVEGGEAAALAGATDLLERDVCFIFECHGSDDESRATRAMVEAGLALFLVDEQGEVSPLASVSDVRVLKVDRQKGYNFVATSPGTYTAVFRDAASR